MSEIHEMAGLARANRGNAIDRVIATAVANIGNTKINGSDLRNEGSLKD